MFGDQTSDAYSLLYADRYAHLRGAPSTTWHPYNLWFTTSLPKGVSTLTFHITFIVSHAQLQTENQVARTRVNKRGQVCERLQARH